MCVCVCVVEGDGRLRCVLGKKEGWSEKALLYFYGGLTRLELMNIFD